MAQDRVQEMLDSLDKDEVHHDASANGILTRLYKIVLRDIGMNGNWFSSLLHAFVTDPKHGHPNDRKMQTQLRGNVRKEFTKDKMTWRVFCKAMWFLQVIRMEISIKLYYREPKRINNKLQKFSLHSTVVDFGSEFYDSLNEEDDDEEDASSYVNSFNQSSE